MAPSVTDSKHASMAFSNYRMSTYSEAPTVQTNYSTESAHEELKNITTGFVRMENHKLASQRYVPTQEKVETLEANRMGAKLEKALERRMQGQDAVMRPRKKTNAQELSEKDSEKVLVE